MIRIDTRTDSTVTVMPIGGVDCGDAAQVGQVVAVRPIGRLGRVTREDLALNGRGGAMAGRWPQSASR